MTTARAVNLGGNIVTTDKGMRPRHPWDYYPTPHALITQAVLKYGPDPACTPRIVDPGAGKGEWGGVLRLAYPAAEIIGVDKYHAPDDPHAAGYTHWIAADYLDWGIYPVDLIVGNPPYKVAEEFIRHSFTLLRAGGVLIFLLRLAFLEGQDRGKHLWPSYPLDKLGVCSRRPSFTNNGKTDATAYAVYRWVKGQAAPPVDFLDYME